MGLMPSALEVATPGRLFIWWSLFLGCLKLMKTSCMEAGAGISVHPLILEDVVNHPSTSKVEGRPTGEVFPGW